jgi:hypothetical protein
VTISAFHQAGAVALLFSMAVFCLCSFKDPQFARSSWARNIYLWGGRLILAFIVVAFVVPRTHVGDHWPITPLYYGEWGAVWSFGFAWTAAALELAGDIGRMGRIRRALNRLSGWLGRFVSFGGNRTGVQPASSHRL